MREWSPHVCRLLYARAGGFPPARRDGHVSQLPCGDIQGLGFQEPGRRKRYLRAAVGMQILLKGIFQEHARPPSGQFVR